MSSDALIGWDIGKYHIKSCLGVGGMGAVYLGIHSLLEKKVAIKIVHPEFTEKADVIGRFFNEARAVSLLNHPNIVELIDFGKAVGPAGQVLHYCIMELLEGETVRARLQRTGTIPEAEAVYIAAQMADAAAVAHNQQIIHRDLKPENVFLIGPQRNIVKLLDFGIAKLSDPDAAGAASVKTQAGVLLGTPSYMSPEQSMGRKVDLRTDIYAAGVILFEMTTGRPPFVGEGFADVLIKQISADVPRPRSLNPTLSERTERAILRALEKDPAQRFQSMAEFHAALPALTMDPGPAETPKVPPPPPPDSGHRRTPINLGRTTPEPVPTPGHRRTPINLGRTTPEPVPAPNHRETPFNLGKTMPEPMPAPVPGPTMLNMSMDLEMDMGRTPPSVAASIPGPPPFSADGDRTPPSLNAAPIWDGANANVGIATRPTSFPMQSSKMPAIVGMAIAMVVVVGGATGWYLWHSSASKRAVVKTHRSAPPVEAPEPLALPIAAPAAKARLHIVSEPDRADVVREDTRTTLGKTPFDAELPATGTVIHLVASLSGYKDLMRSVALTDREHTVSFVLEKDKLAKDKRDKDKHVSKPAPEKKPALAAPPATSRFGQDKMPPQAPPPAANRPTQDAKPGQDKKALPAPPPPPANRPTQDAKPNQDKKALPAPPPPPANRPTQDAKPGQDKKPAKATPPATRNLGNDLLPPSSL